MRLSKAANAGFIYNSMVSVTRLWPNWLQPPDCIVNICLITVHVAICHGNAAVTQQVSDAECLYTWLLR